MTVKYNARNERIKREYFDFLKEAKQQNTASVDAVAKAIARFEEYTNYKEFKKFHREQAIGFKKNLSEIVSDSTGEKLSKSTLFAACRHLKNFFQWLSMQTGYKAQIKYSDADYFNLSAKDGRVARAKRPQRVPSIEEIMTVLLAMPAGSTVEKRNRALIAFTFLTGIRDAATASVKIKHIDFEENKVFQDAREVNTKASKTITTWFFPVGEEVRQMVHDWVRYLKEALGFAEESPLFPKSQSRLSADGEATGPVLIPEHWANATPIRKIFRQAFESAGLPYANPHSFRNTLAKLGEQRCTTAESFKAWSQNLGHEGVLTTLYSYGEVQPERQAEIIKEFSLSDINDQDISLAMQLIKTIKQAKV